jgi:hypothetical protein
LSNIFEVPDYAQIPSSWDDISIRRWNLWSWVDRRDVAQACRLGLEVDVPGADGASSGMLAITTGDNSDDCQYANHR